MNPEIWAAFALAAAVILVIPGPTIILVVSQAVSHGRKSVIPLVLGVVSGDFTAMTFSLMGLGALLSVSVTLFTILKWIGALYLFYIGIRMWRKPAEDVGEETAVPKISSWHLFRSSYIVTALNPKGIAFFLAFLPQFVNPHESASAQLLIMGMTFLVLAGINAALYAVFAGHLRDSMRKGPVRKWFNRCGGSALIGAGVLTAMQTGA
ncbi:MAG: LysE family translocator [Desulfococcaceae bacterium]|jgi:threonine/homoserine/homoserine lactone efflux protein|nr:LysE family translocator [Desulfococcaceae bacterium]